MHVSTEIVTADGGHRLLIGIDGTRIETPPVEHILFYVALGTMAGTGLIEPPVAIALGVGHALLDLTRRPGLQALGEALEEV